MMSEDYEEVPLRYPTIRPQASNDEFVGRGWGVRETDRKFYFAYVSGELAGKMKEIEITQADVQHERLRISALMNCALSTTCLSVKCRYTGQTRRAARTAATSPA